MNPILLLAFPLSVSAILTWVLWRAYRHDKVLSRYGSDIVRAEHPTYFWMTVGFYAVVLILTLVMGAMMAAHLTGWISD